MPRNEATQIWSLNYRLVSEIIVSVAPRLAELDLEVKELFILAAIDDHPYPAGLSASLCMPKPTVTLYLKRLVAAQLVRRQIDAGDLRRHRLSLTAAGRRLMAKGLALLSAAYGTRLARLNTAEQAQLAALLGRLA